MQLHSCLKSRAKPSLNTTFLMQAEATMEHLQYASHQQWRAAACPAGQYDN